MHMIKKGQMILADGKALSAADQFYSLAASLRLLEAGCADQLIAQGDLADTGVAQFQAQADLAAQLARCVDARFVGLRRGDGGDNLKRGVGEAHGGIQ